MELSLVDFLKKRGMTGSREERETLWKQYFPNGGDYKQAADQNVQLLNVMQGVHIPGANIPGNVTMPTQSPDDYVTRPQAVPMDQLMPNQLTGKAGCTPSNPASCIDKATGGFLGDFFSMTPGNVIAGAAGAKYPRYPLPANIALSLYDAITGAAPSQHTMPGVSPADPNATPVAPDQPWTPFSMMPQNWAILGPMGATHGNYPPPANAAISLAEKIGLQPPSYADSQARLEATGNPYLQPQPKPFTETDPRVSQEVVVKAPRPTPPGADTPGIPARGMEASGQPGTLPPGVMGDPREYPPMTAAELEAMRLRAAQLSEESKARNAYEADAGKMPMQVPQYSPSDPRQEYPALTSEELLRQKADLQARKTQTQQPTTPGVQPQQTWGPEVMGTPDEITQQLLQEAFAGYDQGQMDAAGEELDQLVIDREIAQTQKRERARDLYKPTDALPEAKVDPAPQYAESEIPGGPHLPIEEKLRQAYAESQKVDMPSIVNPAPPGMPQASPPKTQQEYEERKAGWLEQLTKFTQQPNAREIMMTMALRLMQGTRPGQGTLGAIGDSIQLGMMHKGMLDHNAKVDAETARKQKMEDEKHQLDMEGKRVSNESARYDLNWTRMTEGQRREKIALEIDNLKRAGRQKEAEIVAQEFENGNLQEAWNLTKQLKQTQIQTMKANAESTRINALKTPTARSATLAARQDAEETWKRANPKKPGETDQQYDQRSAQAAMERLTTSRAPSEAAVLQARIKYLRDQGDAESLAEADALEAQLTGASSPSPITPGGKQPRTIHYNDVK